MYVELILITGLLLFCFPPLLYLFVILFGVIIPVQAGSLILAIRVIFKEDADFKSAYIRNGSCSDNYGYSFLYSCIVIF